MNTRIAIFLLSAVVAAGASAAQRGFEPGSSPAQPAPELRMQHAVMKPDIEPVKPGWVPTSTPGVGSIGARLYAKNNGPGTLEQSFAWRLSCRVIAKEFDLGPCLYKTLQQALNAEGANPTLTAHGAIGNMPAPTGQQVWHQFASPMYVNCRHDMGGKCHIELEVDVQNTVAEGNEGNNAVVVLR